MGQAAEALQEGNPFDRTIYFILILLAIGILISRCFRWGDFFARNMALMAFLSFALVSVIWSDFPFVAFKRWFRDLGNYLVILVVLSDPSPAGGRPDAASTSLLSADPALHFASQVLPRDWQTVRFWTGTAKYVGATTSKNMLGVLCLVSGLFFFWDTVTRWSDRKERRTRRIILVNRCVSRHDALAAEPLEQRDLAVCLVLGCLVIAAAHSKGFRRHPGFLKVLIPAGFCIYLILAFGFGMNSRNWPGPSVGTQRSPTEPRYGVSFLACTPIHSLAPATRASG